MNDKKKWVSVVIPRSLYEEAKALVKQRDSRYSSMSSFFSEAIRLRLEEIRKYRSLPSFKIDQLVDPEDRSPDH